MHVQLLLFKSIGMNLQPAASFKRWLNLTLLLLGLVGRVKADSTDAHPHRLPVIAATGTGLYVLGVGTFSTYWYGANGFTRFHFFNDDTEWLQMDKMGHGFTAYQEGYHTSRMLQWAGLSYKKSVWIGGALGLALQTPIEILDGFSPDWGFSWGDYTANTVGSALFIAEGLMWPGQAPLQPKFSYHATHYATLNPSLLGSVAVERFIKDYNGQTYWLSFPLHYAFPKLGIPKWLMLSGGYGASGLVRATAADQLADTRFAAIPRQRQFYLSFDFDLRTIHTRSKLANTLISAVSFLKIPFPALYWEPGRRFGAYPLYF